MKKLWVLAGSVLLFFSCSSSPYYYNAFYTRIKEWTFDDSVAQEKSSDILFVSNLTTLNTYNGMDIKDAFLTEEKVPNGLTLNVIPLLKIPAGAAELNFDTSFDRFDRHYVNNVQYYTRYTVKDCHFKYNFEPGKKYVVGLQGDLKKGTSKDEYSYYVRIYNYFPEFEILSGGRVDAKKLASFMQYYDSKDFASYLVDSILIFETDKLSQ